MLLNVFTTNVNTMVTQNHYGWSFFKIHYTFLKMGTNCMTNPSDGARFKLSIFTDLKFIQKMFNEVFKWAKINEITLQCY